MFALFATGVVAADIVDTSGKVASGINNTSETGGKICVVDTGLPPVSLIPVVHLDLQISPRIKKKIETVLMGYSEDGGN